MNPGSETIASVEPGAVLVLLLLAAGSAQFLAWLYQDIHGPSRSGGDLRVAFPLIAVALTALFLTVQLSLPLSLGLLAALTLIRFRTPVKEPEEIAFVVSVVAVSAMLATMRIALTGVMLACAAVAVLTTKALTRRQRDVHGLLVLSMPTRGLEGSSMPGLAGHACRLESISVHGTEAVLAYRFAASSEARIRAVEVDLQRRLPLARATVLVDAPELGR
jgi:hypothetical protein